MAKKLKLGRVALNSMRRRFLPIGQGAFYCESFMLPGADEPFNVVFDCGVDPKSCVDERLAKIDLSFLGPSRTIHVLFISHFDCDHYDGVDVLRDTYNVTFKHVYYPGIDMKDKWLMELWLKLSGQQDSFIYDLCLNQPSASAQLPNAKLIPIPPTPPITDSRRQTDPTSDPSNLQLTDLLQAIGRPPLPTGNPFQRWTFRNFNYRNAALIKNLRTTVFNRFLKSKSKNRIWSNPAKRNAIVRSYKTATKGDGNAYSMTMYSGIAAHYPSALQQNLMCCRTRNCPLTMAFKPGCLYTGDYNATIPLHWKKLKEHFELNWPEIGCVQIPHHGSCQGFNPQFLDMDAIFVASVGTDNSYRHPTPNVLLTFQQRNKHLFCVTEDVNSCLCTMVSC